MKEEVSSAGAKVIDLYEIGCMLSKDRFVLELNPPLGGTMGLCKEVSGEELVQFEEGDNIPLAELFLDVLGHRSIKKLSSLVKSSR